jgi:hypothetical protein
VRHALVAETIIIPEREGGVWPRLGSGLRAVASRGVRIGHLWCSNHSFAAAASVSRIQATTCHHPIQQIFYVVKAKKFTNDERASHRRPNRPLAQAIFRCCTRRQLGYRRRLRCRRSKAHLRSINNIFIETELCVKGIRSVLKQVVKEKEHQTNRLHIAAPTAKGKIGNISRKIDDIFDILNERIKRKNICNLWYLLWLL